MKRIISMLLCAVLLLVPLTPSITSVTEADAGIRPEEGIEYFEDGSFLIVISEEEEHDTTSPTFLQKLLNLMKKLIDLLFPGREKTVTRTKYAEYFDANGKGLWSISLSADFSYNGKTVNCTDARISYTIYDSDWKLVSSSCSKSGATATGEFAFRQHKLGVPLKLIEKVLMLTCNADGKVS